MMIAVSSMLAARYFSTLNMTLTTTVGELETKTGELTDARNESQENAAENLRLADKAETARQASQTMLADMQTERGVLALEEGDPASAMLWFANAAVETPHDPHRQSANRLRAQNAMNLAVPPVASLRHNCRGHLKRLEFPPLDRSLDDNDGPLVGEGTRSTAGHGRPASEVTGDCGNLILVTARDRVEIWDW